MSKRNVGLDCLKIIAMLMIVFIHVIGKGMFRYEANNVEFYKIALFIRIFCIVAVNCYVLITGYFQIESKFNTKKIINIWGKVLFYSISIYIMLLLLGQVNFNIKDVIKSIFPILTNEYWFVNCYLLLYILSPFINKMINQLDKKEFKKLLIILLVVFSIFPSVLPVSFTMDNTRGYGIIWFIVLYLIGAYIRLYGNACYKNRNNLLTFFLISIVSYGLVILVQYICNKLHFLDMSERIYNYNFFTIFLASVFLFLFFKNINIKSLKVTNLVSKIVPLTFGVYIIHEQVVLRNYLYLNILHLNDFWNKITQFIIIPSTAIVIFLICLVIEKITKNTIQKFICNKLEKIYLAINKRVKNIRKFKYEISNE